MSRVLFVVPPYDCWGVQVIGTWPPLQIAYLAAAAERAGCEARIYDAMSKGTTFDEVRAELASYRPDVVVTFDFLPVTGAISTATVPAALETLRLAKELDPRVTTVLGGPLPTFLFSEILKDPANRVDVVLRGEVEETFAELVPLLPSGGLDGVQGIAFRRGGEVVATPLRPHVAELDALRPAWHLVDWRDYHYKVEPYGRMAAMLTSRGCMMGCSFCSHRQFWRGDWRARHPEDVLREVRELVHVHGVEFITLIDPYPTHDRERWERILDLLIAARLPVKLLMETRVEDVLRDEALLPKYRDAGVIHMYLGAEGSSDEMLVSLNKGTTVDVNKRAVDLARAHDIVTEASFMIGGPTETWASVERTIAEAIRVDPDIAVFPVLTPMPFTPIHAQMKDRIRVTDWSKYNLATPIVEPFELSLEDVSVALGRCYMEFYARKMPQIVALPDGFKRRYMLSAFRAMMKGYRQHFSFLGLKMPRMHRGDA
ncbi:B12-binding domain-containing radical SAM protein [Anaeromyxobacter paludicola]|uniref:Magnesium-protoporphyrin IX monomethyl ester cyclase n=1 Tax=Anaeromyxobacter paludicola TaxID=2918171 RepID=A0ABM7XFB4_9BACT|nr:radical SAM protein [Anaeromyxobacter paludicola]BDG10574.1 magnesium-protoporphyrin IX monomethyl ester cyclase [Anaeromyxobacter paludicola]